MNLFSSTQAPPADSVQAAIRNAAATTGAGFDYLLTTARRESGLDPAARAKSSSATGLFQFIDSTWLQMVKEAGPALGLGDYAAGIEKSAGGGYVAPDATTRRAILALRNDPDVNARMAGALTQQNRQALGVSLGREPSAGELYIAHFMGAQGASSLIRLAATDGDAEAAQAFPRQAGANPAIFYDKGGRSRSTAEVYASLVSRFDGVAATSSPALLAEAEDKLPSSPAAWLAIPAHNAYAAEAATPFHSLFRSTAGAPISNYVAATWSNLGPAARASGAPAGAGPAAAVQAMAPQAGSRVAPVQIRPGVAADALPVPLAPARNAAPAEAGFMGSVGSFISTLFATSQAAPLRDGKAWGG